MGGWNSIISWFEKLWRELAEIGKKIFKYVLRFAVNIVSFFKKTEQRELLKSNKNILPIVLKEKLANGRYNVINCLFDTEKDDVVNIKRLGMGYECEEFDSELTNKFGNEDMIVLR